MRFASRYTRLIAPLALVGLALVTPADAAKRDTSVFMLQVPNAMAQGVRTLQAQMVVNVPPEVVWATMTQYNDYDRFLPGYQNSTVVSRSGRSSLVNLAVRPAPLTPLYRYQVRATEQTNYRLSFERLSGDMKFLKATYQLTPKSNGRQTLISYTVAIDPGSTLPGANNILKVHTEKTFQAIASQSEDNARKSLIGQR